MTCTSRRCSMEGTVSWVAGACDPTGCGFCIMMQSVRSSIGPQASLLPSSTPERVLVVSWADCQVLLGERRGAASCSHLQHGTFELLVLGCGTGQSCHPTCQRLYPSFAVLSILLSPSDCVSRNGRQVAGPFFKLASRPFSS